MVSDYANSTEIALNVVQNCLIVTLPREIPDEKFSRIGDEILHRVHGRSIRGVILDLSTVRVLDTYAFKALADISKMALLLGAPTIFAGLQPGVVSALVDLEDDFSGIHAALTMADAFLKLPPSVQGDDQEEEDDEVSAAAAAGNDNDDDE